jgi:hypothetical protein
MYCPYCGREMELIDGVFTCVVGDMPFSGHMHTTMSERFPTHKNRPADAEFGRRLTRWFCPGCGVPLDSNMACPKCRGSIRDQLFRLVELHPHRDDV